jgi:hypothetical protein
MKKELLLLLLSGSMLVGCHSDIKLDNVDTTTQLGMGLALKVATVTATLGDFIDQSEDLFIYRDSTSGGTPKMVVAWRHAYPDEKDYHAVDFMKYMPDTTKSMNVYDQLQAKGLIGPNGKITPDGSQVTLDFDMQFKFSGVNEVGSNNENRIDSAYIDYAQFISSIGRHDLPLEWEWIDSVVLDLGDQIECENKVRTIYRRGEGAGYDTDIETNLNNFKIMLMKNRDIRPAISNVYSGCDMQVHFMFTIPASAGEIEVPQTAAFQYHIKLADARWQAIWGYFTPSKDMYSDERVDMDEYLHDYPFAKRAKLPFSDPKIEVEISTHIAGRMVVEGSNLYVIDANDQRVDATFNGSTTRPAEYLDPYMDPADLSNMGDSALTRVVFNNTAKDGDIERLFRTMPKWLNYKFEVYFDRNKTPQIRVTPNTNIRINAICTLPLMFERNLFIDYQDTITGVDLKDVDVDSLANQVDFIDSLHVSEVTLYLTARNYIPLTLKGKVRFMDANNQPVMDPEDPSKEFYPFLEDTIRFAPPTYVNIGGYVMPDANQPGKTLITTRMTQKKMEALKQIKSIEYKVYADNDALKYAYDMGLDKLRLEKDSRLYIDIGVTAQIDALMNFENKK